MISLAGSDPRAGCTIARSPALDPCRCRSIHRPGLVLRFQSGWLPAEARLGLLHHLSAEVRWSQPLVRVHGRLHPLPRLVAWYGDLGCCYRYSGLGHDPQPWSRCWRVCATAWRKPWAIAATACCSTATAVVSTGWAGMPMMSLTSMAAIRLPRSVWGHAAICVSDPVLHSLPPFSIKAGSVQAMRMGWNHSISPSAVSPPADHPQPIPPLSASEPLQASDATASISTFAPLGRAATCTQARAGATPAAKTSA